VWIVEPDNQTVLVFRSLTAMQQYGTDDTLVGEGLLEGFTLTVASLFAQ
jgi:Uma2 family endonuclease